MNNREIKWKGPPVPRAKPIPQDTWEGHRQEICQLYQNMTLEDVMMVMKVRHRFTPSRRQYTFQLRKWEVHKQSVKTEDSLSIENTQNKGSRAIPQVELNTENSLQQSSPSPNSDKKGHTTSSITHEDIFRRGNSSFPRDNQSSLRQSSYRANASMDVRKEPVPLPHKHASLETSHNSSTSQDSISPEDLDYENEDTSMLSHKESDDGDVDMLISPTDHDQSNSAEIIVRENLIDLDGATYSSDPQKIKELKLAADFLYASQCREDSFILYVLLLKQLKESSSDHSWMIMHALLGCARSCVTPNQAEIARNLLEQQLSKQSLYNEESVEFLFRSLLADICCRQGDNDSGMFHHHLALQSNTVLAQSLMLLSPYDRTLDLVTHQYLNRALKCQGHFLAARNVTDQILYQEPGPFEFKGGRMNNDCIRLCLKWCINEWSKDRFMYGSWKNLESHDKNMLRMELLGTFSELWQRWQRRRPQIEDQTQLLGWVHQVEQAMGITPSELLAITCLMMLNACPIIDRIFPDRDRKIFPESKYLPMHIPKVATRGGEVLSEGSDWELAHSFLKAYSSLNSPLEEDIGDVNHASLAREYSRAFLQESMQLQLPEIQRSPENDLSKAIDHFNATKKKVPSSTGSILPTIASSLQSSDLSSLRLLKERIQDQFENMSQGSHVQLPSSIIEDASVGSLSLLSVLMKNASKSSLNMSLPSSMSGTSESMKESITTASSRVKDQIVAWNSRHSVSITS